MNARDKVLAKIRDAIRGEKDGTTIPIPVEDLRALLDELAPGADVGWQNEFQDSLVNDGTYEYTISSDCDGSNVIHYRRTPKRVITAGPWESVS
jgi:hypothetical protein